jgi:hypothetical protein
VDDRNKHDTIIERKDPFEVRFRVELKGRLWYCICGHWCFDLGFTSIGKGEHFNLSDYLPEPEKSKLRICDWKGCDTRCIEVCVRVPPNTIPVERCGTLYEVGAKFELRCCGDCDDECGGHLALAGLADADQEVIYRALGSFKPRPTRSQIAQWQSQARSRLGETQGEDGARSGEQAPGQPDEAQSRPDEVPSRPDEARSRQDEAAVDTEEWHPVASFAVVFMQRRAGDTWERRVEAERTEVEPEREREVWPGWECNPVCGWMLGQLGQADGGPGQPDQPRGGQPDQARGGQPEPAAEPAGAGKPRGKRPQLRIDSAAITDAAGSSDLVTDGAPVADPPAELMAPSRVAFTVSGARRGTEVQAVARLRGHGGPGRNVADPVAVPASGRAEFDLSQVAAGQLDITLLAWAPDCTARHVSVGLPAMRISPGPEEDPGHD